MLLAFRTLAAALSHTKLKDLQVERIFFGSSGKDPQDAAIRLVTDMPQFRLASALARSCAGRTNEQSANCARCDALLEAALSAGSEGPEPGCHNGARA